MRELFRLLGFEAVVGLVLFGTAGRWDLPWFWAVLGVHVALMLAALALMDPGLRRERVRPGPGGQDRNLRRIVPPLLLAQMAVAGLDAGRFHWSGPIPSALHAAALAGYAGGTALGVWAIAVNRFFSPVVRIQGERGHHLVTAGPYRVVRHPGYLAILVAAPCGSVALGSWWSLVALAPLPPLLVRRIRLEERLLRAELPGYAGYAGRVRARLVPGVW